MKTMGFIGIGNMGSAMAKSIMDNKYEEVVVYDHNKACYKNFENNKYAIIADNLEELVKNVKYIVLSIKPQYYPEVCHAIKKYLKADHIIITVAPSYTIQNIKQILGAEVKVIRTMPNTPALIGAGVTAYTYNAHELVRDEIENFLTLFNCFGQSLYVDENLMSAVVATTGSSPAYGYMFIEAMADAAVSFGMPRDMAYEMSARAIKGACEMVLQTKKHPGELKDAVTSPGGTTIQAVIALEEAGFRSSVVKGMTACYNKANQMTNEK